MQVQYQNNPQKARMCFSGLYIPNEFVKKLGGQTKIITQAEKRKDGKIWIIINNQGIWERLSDYQQSNYTEYQETSGFWCNCKKPIAYGATAK